MTTVMQETIFVYALVAALAIALLIAAATDIRRRQIDNWLNAGIALAAPLYWWAQGLTLWPGVAIQIGLAVAAFLVFAAMFALKVMGGGDVKLLTALALWLPAQMFLKMLVVMAIAGGMLTIVLGMWHITRRRRDQIKIPYGVAIAGAGLWALSPQLTAAMHAVGLQ